MNTRLKKFLFLVPAVALLFSVSFIQKSLNTDRESLGLTYVEPLDNAPPMLAFTTVALGGFRGLIANALWIRASDLQDEDKFFEAKQLADWITKLEPHYSQVWVNQAWNMSYNISVKFKDYADRWRWVQAGIELLRDEGLRYNPTDVLIFRELGWQFQHKMGQNLDDANMYYKQAWAKEMTDAFGGDEPNFDQLISPQTEEEKKRVEVLTNKFKLDPKFMKEVNERYGPLEWRLPEAHAIYWYAYGLERAKENPTKVNPSDLIQLRRGIYQSMQLAFHRGRLVKNPFQGTIEFGPNLDIFPKVDAAYQEMYDEEPDAGQRDGIQRARKNLIKDAVYFYYINNRMAEARKWYQVLIDKFPDTYLLDNNFEAHPTNTSLDEYAVGRWQGDVNETSRDKIKAFIEGALLQAYQNLIAGYDDRAAGFKLLAQKVRDRYEKEISSREKAIGQAPLEETAKDVVNRLLDPEKGLPYEMRAILRTKLGMPAEPPPGSSTNAPPVSPTSPASTNAPVSSAAL